MAGLEPLLTSTERADMKIITTLLLALLSHFAQAAVTVSPVHPNVLPGQRSASLTVSNDSDQSATLDVRVKKWLVQNLDGTDLLDDTDSVILSRPVVVVPARASVTIRLIVRSRSTAPEDTYRVIVNDITPPTSDGKVALRMNSVLPFFVLNAGDSKGKLDVKSGLLTNIGSRHVRISGYTDATGKSVNLLRYVFPGQSIRLPVDTVNQVVFSDDIY